MKVLLTFIKNNNCFNSTCIRYTIFISIFHVFWFLKMNLSLDQRYLHSYKLYFLSEKTVIISKEYRSLWKLDNIHTYFEILHKQAGADITDQLQFRPMVYTCVTCPAMDLTGSEGISAHYCTKLWKISLCEFSSMLENPRLAKLGCTHRRCNFNS